MSARIDETKPLQMKKIVAQCTVCHCGINLSADIGKLVYKLSENRPVQATGQKLFTLY
jgi:hypothetical protein